MGDEEDLGQISGADGVAVVHLSVHPSAWKGSPPSVPKNEERSRKDKGKEREVVPTPTTSLPSTTTTSSPPEFILWKHRDALSKLTLSATPTSPSASACTEAVTFVNRHGFVWPSILDESYPLSKGETGVKYEKVVIRYISTFYPVFYLSNPSHVATSPTFVYSTLPPPLQPNSTHSKSSHTHSS